MPVLNPQTSARKAMEDFDKNKDGCLDKKELENCPGVQSALKSLDKDGDGRVSEAEIAQWLAHQLAEKTALHYFPLRLLRYGRPLAGAKVTLVPEKFLQPALKPAEGVSDEEGHVVYKVEGAPMAGAPIGFYRVEISLKDSSGREFLPARYNTQTILGLVIPPESAEGVLFKLK